MVGRDRGVWGVLTSDGVDVLSIVEPRITPLNGAGVEDVQVLADFEGLFRGNVANLAPLGRLHHLGLVIVLQQTWPSKEEECDASARKNAWENERENEWDQPGSL